MNDVNSSWVKSDIFFLIKKWIFYHPRSEYMRGLFRMWRHQKYSWFLEWLIFIIKSFMKLNQLNHEAIIRAGNYTFLFNEGFSLFVVITVLKDNISDNKGYWSGYALNTMDKDIFLVFMGILDEVNNSIKKTFDILILWIFEEEGEIRNSFGLKPILTIIPSTIDDVFDLVLLQSVKIFGDFLSRHIETFDNFAAFLLALLPFASSLFRTVCDSWGHLQRLICSSSFCLFVNIEI